MIQNIDAVFVLTVKTFHERIKHIEKHFAERQIEFEFIFDFDPPELSQDCLQQFIGESKMGIPQKSLVMKHIQAWRLGLERGCGNILVFEDDAILKKDFILKIKHVMSEADKFDPGYLVNLGGYDTKVPDDFFLHDGLLIRQPIATTEGYLSDAESLKRRMQWLQENKVSLPADHLLQHIDKECGIAQYWLEKPLVQQGSVFGMFHTYLDGSRKKHSNFYNYMRYHWNHFWRRWFRKKIVLIKYAAFGRIS
ncbi:MAG: hypothetical protein HGA70_00565 [Chlorobiaceae bacterium]|nr:hypothetical protein [Chlorobiaceae bacterium]